MTDLPATIGRWTPKRKRELVASVARGDIALDDALLKYGISAEEFEDWKRGHVAAMERAR